MLVCAVVLCWTSSSHRWKATVDQRWMESVGSMDRVQFNVWCWCHGVGETLQQSTVSVVHFGAITDLLMMSHLFIFRYMITILVLLLDWSYCTDRAMEASTVWVKGSVFACVTKTSPAPSIRPLCVMLSVLHSTRSLTRERFTSGSLLLHQVRLYRWFMLHIYISISVGWSQHINKKLF